MPAVRFMRSCIDPLWAKALGRAFANRTPRHLWDSLLQVAPRDGTLAHSFRAVNERFGAAQETKDVSPGMLRLFVRRVRQSHVIPVRADVHHGFKCHSA
jgi:hypothetical protein